MPHHRSLSISPTQTVPVRVQSSCSSRGAVIIPSLSATLFLVPNILVCQQGPTCQSFDHLPVRGRSLSDRIWCCHPYFHHCRHCLSPLCRHHHHFDHLPSGGPNPWNHFHCHFHYVPSGASLSVCLLEAEVHHWRSHLENSIGACQSKLV